MSRYNAERQTMNRAASICGALLVASTLFASTVEAQPYNHAVRIDGAVGIILSDPHTELFGTGGGLGLGYEYRIHDYIGIDAHFSSFWFASDNPNVTFASYYAPSAGVRVHPIPSLGVADIYAGGRAALAITGGEVRLGVEAELGVDFRLTSRFRLGPYARYTHIFQPDDNVLGAPDGQYLAVGFEVSVVFGAEDPDDDDDGDGVRNGDDDCPNQDEDMDGFEDHDGCPELDNDGDGFEDRVDSCPLAPEDVDQFQDTDGCPEADNDNDGILDGVDACPNQPEDMDGEEDEDGCPENAEDEDGDGVPDDTDECVAEAEDLDGFEDANGCPDPDNDQDGIPDTTDECPTAPGTAENRGCPVSVRMAPGGIQILMRIEFRTDQARLMRRSEAVLREVASVLEANPQIQHLQIAGHTDNRATPESNQALSEARAESVKAWLVENGVDAARLRAVGFGEARPLLSGDTEIAHRTNRRVEFVIMP
ncbi:MAG: outer membrane protein OmpA-like peptidoglycan-associated protein [Polyangiales bacterium]|jgi:outer membrane protein OmpA-like peptidoglycan-associated protein